MIVVVLIESAIFPAGNRSARLDVAGRWNKLGAQSLPGDGGEKSST
jgi:hypothetical protein